MALPSATGSEPAVLLDFEDWQSWKAGHAAKAAISTEQTDGHAGSAIRVRYDVINDHWVEIGREVGFEWKRVDAFHFYLRGDANGSVFELKLKDGDGSYYGLKLPVTGVATDRWTRVSVPFRDCHYLWGGDSTLDTVASVWFAVSRGLKRAGVLDIDEFSFTPKEPGAPTVQIHASQIGYHPWDDKTFVVRVLELPPAFASAGTFRVVPLGGDTHVYEGSLRRSDFKMWEGQFLTGDFSRVRTPGVYQIQVLLRNAAPSDAQAVSEWAAVSYPFHIEDRVLAERTARQQYSYARYMRCGIVCHKDDPVPGGYHDTQMDISKRMWSIPHFILGLARYAAHGTRHFDADTDGVDDVDDELRFGLRFIADIPEPDGTVSWGGIEADFKPFMSYDDFIVRLGPLKREEDTLPRVKYLEKNLHSTCFNVVALLEAADAARRIDSDLADRAVRVARTAWAWIDAQPLEKSYDYGVYLYAAASLHRRFPDGGYLRRLDAVLPALLDLQSLDPSIISNGAVGNFFFSQAERDFHFQYKYVSFNVAIHLGLILLEEDLPRSHPLWPRIHYANTVFAKSYLPAMAAGTPYGQIAHGLEPGPDRRFYPRQFAGKAGERAAASFHGLNCDHFGYAHTAMKLAQLYGDADLERFADEQIQWALGKNPLGYCMMAGAGSRNPIHMSAFYDKGPITGEIPNGIVSGKEHTEEPEWWGDGPSSGEDWLPHNSYYLSLIPELDRDAELSLVVTRAGAPVTGTVRVVREDGRESPPATLVEGKSDPISLTPQAGHSVRIYEAEALIYTKVITPVSGQKLNLQIDLARDVTFELEVLPGSDLMREVKVVLASVNRSAAPVDVMPRVSMLGGRILTGVPERISVPADGRREHHFVVRADGGKPVLIRVEDLLDPRISADGYWVSRMPPDAAAAGEKAIDEMSDAAGWKTEKDQGATILTRTENGALRVDYEMGSKKWVQVKKEIPMDLREYGILEFRVKGEGSPSRLEVKLEDADGVNVGRAFDRATAVSEWRDYAIPFKDFQYWWGGDGIFDWEKLRHIYFAVSTATGGKGTVWIDDVKLDQDAAKKLEALAPQARYEYVKGDESVAKKAAAWITSMQQPGGMIMSYVGDNKPFAWTYDQGLCLIVLAHENRPAAERLLEALRRLQRPEGFWNDGYMLDVGETLTLSEKDRAKWLPSDAPGVLYEFDNQWIGSAAWVIYGIHRYTQVTGDTRYVDMMNRGAAWLASQQKPDGSLHNVTEGNMTSWRALKAAGLDTAADRLKTYLLTKVWNAAEGRFQVSPTDAQPYLDVQTWGANFASDAGSPDYGLKSLAFARRHLACKTFDLKIRGFDATGPYTVWNEGTLQYVVAGGEGAEDYLAEMNKQQREDGALRHSTDEHSEGGAWHTMMYGVCPTAWLYFANTGAEPFPPGGVK